MQTDAKFARFDYVSLRARDHSSSCVKSVTRSISFAGFSHGQQCVVYAKHAAGADPGFGSRGAFFFLKTSNLRF